MHSSHNPSGKFPGLPAQGFGLFTSLLLAFAAGFLVFFAATTLAIFGLLALNFLSGHKVNYAASYLYIGLPAGLIVLAAALVILLALWIRARIG